MNNIQKSTITILASALLLAGCSSGVGADVSSPPPSPPPSTSVPTTEVVPELEPTSEPVPEYTEPVDPFTEEPREVVASFGETITWDDGLAVKVSAPKFYEPGEYAAGAKKWNAVFSVTLKNGTSKRYDPTGLYLTASDSGGDLERIFDSNLPSDPSVSLRAGKSVTWKVAYGLNSKSLKGLTIQVQPFSLSSENYATAIFEN
ncbi:hypothetical protein ACFQU3_19720 [Terrabacter sp. GCM10028922]|uniref:hypothetical protein n=1 Tax=Terrabacter sp. GCM10028922 TaxID=3273428 RepID=UPI00361D8400